jgi:hypothetical protein
MMEKKADIKEVETALQAAFTQVHPPREVLQRLQVRVQDIARSAHRPAAKTDAGRQQNLTFIGLAGVFAVLVTLAVGFRSAGSIIGALTLANEVNRQMKSRKSNRLTPTG